MKNLQRLLSSSVVSGTILNSIGPLVQQGAVFNQKYSWAITATGSGAGVATLRLRVSETDSACRPWVSQQFIKELQNNGEFAKLKLLTGIGHVTFVYTPTVGILSGYNSRTYTITQGMIDPLVFFKRFGGYDPFLALT